MCFSMYSLMSKRMNSLPSCFAACLASSVLPTPVGPVKRKQPTGTIRGAEAGARALDRLRDELDRLLLVEDHAVQRLFEGAQPLLVGERGLLLGNARHPRDHTFDQGQIDIAGIHLVEAKRRARLVEQVERAVRQAVLAHVSLGELRRAVDRIVLDRDLVVLLKPVLEAEQDLHGVGHRRLLHHDLLKAAEQRLVLLDDLELVERGGADDPDVAFLEDGLHHVRKIEGAPAGGARAHHGVDLVDEEDRLRTLLEGRDHLLETLLEVAAIAGAREHGAGVEGEDLGALQELGRVVLEQGLGEAVDDRGLARHRGRPRAPDCSCGAGRGSRGRGGLPSRGRSEDREDPGGRVR